MINKRKAYRIRQKIATGKHTAAEQELLAEWDADVIARRDAGYSGEPLPDAPQPDPAVSADEPAPPAPSSAPPPPDTDTRPHAVRPAPGTGTGPDWRDKYRRAGESNSSRQYTCERIAAQWVSLLQRVCADTSAHGGTPVLDPRELYADAVIVIDELLPAAVLLSPSMVVLVGSSFLIAQCVRQRYVHASSHSTPTPQETQEPQSSPAPPEAPAPSANTESVNSASAPSASTESVADNASRWPSDTV